MTATKLWVDDLRDPPDDTWTVARTSHKAIYFLAGIKFDLMSLDHDLGGDDTTRKVVLWLCENPGRWPRGVVVHSANPVGRSWLLGMIDRYQPADDAA